MPQQFSAERDREVIAAGGFYCEVCLTGKPVIERSEDSRCCRGCYLLIQKDKQADDASRGDHWIEGKGVYHHYNRDYVLRLVGKEVKTIALPKQAVETPSDNAGGNAEPSITCDKNTDGVRTRGRPVTPPVTVAKVKELALQGLSSRTIASQLSFEGLAVSYRTVARMVKV